MWANIAPTRSNQTEKAREGEIFRQTHLEEARKGAGVIDNAFDGVEVDEVVEKVEETVVESLVEALEVEKKKFFVKGRSKTLDCL